MSFVTSAYANEPFCFNLWEEYRQKHSNLSCELNVPTLWLSGTTLLPANYYHRLYELVWQNRVNLFALLMEAVHHRGVQTRTESNHSEHKQTVYQASKHLFWSYCQPWNTCHDVTQGQTMWLLCAGALLFAWPGRSVWHDERLKHTTGGEGGREGGGRGRVALANSLTRQA